MTKFKLAFQETLATTIPSRTTQNAILRLIRKTIATIEAASKARVGETTEVSALITNTASLQEATPKLAHAAQVAHAALPGASAEVSTP